jgi:hypothetical protein
MTLATIGKNKEYRIFIPLSDNKVHAFMLDGQAAGNWPSPGLNEEIRQPVKVLHNNKTDYIFITGKNGHLLVCDRKGKPVLKSVKNILVSANSEFYINKTNRKGLFLTTDPTGKVLYFQQSGKISEVTFNLFSTGHRFLYLDINNDGNYEFIFTDRSKISFYNRFSKLVYSYTFRRDITVPPFILNLPDGKKLIGAVSGSANEVYLFGINGWVDIPPGIRGNSGFTIFTPENGAGSNLLIGSGKYLKNYYLTK